MGHDGPVLELRAVVPSSLTAGVRAVLEGHPGVTALTLAPGVGLHPNGDLITATVLREAGDDVISALRDLGVIEQGSLTVTEPRLVLSHDVVEAEHRVPGSALDTVIWDEVSRRTSEDASMSGTYLLLMVCAMLIAGIGVLSDSAVLIVAAMVVGPDFGPTAATAVGIASRRWGVARHAFITLLVGFAVGIVATMVLALALLETGIFTLEEVQAPRPYTAFIYQVGWPSVLIAAIAGVVGMVSLTTAKSGALVGVFISVTTIPAAANAAVALVYRLPGEGWESLWQLAVNIITIQVAAGLTLLVERGISRRSHSRIVGQLRERVTSGD